MLRELHISNFALIEKLTVPFDHKLNVLTGETGAGKSILIEALSLVLGERADTSTIRSGAKSSSVEALFDIRKNGKLKKILSELCIEPENNQIILRRTLFHDSGSRSFINDKPVTLKVMKRIGDVLVDIHGQHEHQTLLKSYTHINYLDAFLKLVKERDMVRKLFNTLQEKRKILEERKKKIADLKEKEELYRFQIKEIDKAQLTVKEDMELEQRQRILENAENLIRTVKESYECLYEKEGSVVEILNRIKTSIDALCEIDTSLHGGREELKTALFSIEEAAHIFSQYLQKMEYDPQELELVTERLDSINTLKMKYGTCITDILFYRDEKKRQIKELEETEIKTDKLEEEIKQHATELAAAAYKLSEERMKRKKELEKKVDNELKDLGMESSTFTIGIKRTTVKDGIPFPDGNIYRIHENGIDRVEFLISTNPGEPCLELKKIASGGELSRIMLALKSILASLDDVYCMIFDEVDAGIGGAVAEEVGNKMKQVSTERQVITITHLHQIAAKADMHVKIEKKKKNARAITSAKVLSKEERIEEVARLISGEKLTCTALEHARALLKKEDDKNS